MSTLTSRTTVVLVLVASLAIFAVAWTWHTSLYGPAETDGKQTEHYVDSANGNVGPTDDNIATVSAAFKAALGRKATRNEMLFYTNELDNARLDKDDIVTLLRMSTAPAPTPQVERFPDKQGYGAVIDAFATVLSRLPRDDEVDAYYASIASGQMTKAGLELSLTGSDEYRSRTLPEKEKETFDGATVADAVVDAAAEASEATLLAAKRASQDSLITAAYVDIYGAPPDVETLDFLANEISEIDRVNGHLGAKPIDRDAIANILRSTRPSTRLNSRSASFDPNGLRSNVFNGSAVANGSKAAPVEPFIAKPTYTNDVDEFYAALCTSQIRHPDWSPCRRSSTVPVYSQPSQSSLIGTLLGDARDTKVGSIVRPFTYHET